MKLAGPQAYASLWWVSEWRLLVFVDIVIVIVIDLHSIVIWVLNHFGLLRLLDCLPLADQCKGRWSVGFNLHGA